VGIILDSSVIVTAERRGQSVRQILELVQASQGETEVGLSVVTVAELVHGAYRAKTQPQQQRRLEFIERLCQDVPVHPVTLDIAWLVGRIEGQQEAKGLPDRLRGFGHRCDRAASWLCGHDTEHPSLPVHSWALDRIAGDSQLVGYEVHPIQNGMTKRSISEVPIHAARINFFRIFVPTRSVPTPSLHPGASPEQAALSCLRWDLCDRFRPDLGRSSPSFCPEQ
jgi:predicted nucleic acid-binding protein